MQGWELYQVRWDSETEELRNKHITPNNDNDGIEIFQDKDRRIMAISQSAAAPLPCLEYRSCCPRSVYRRRIVDSIEMVQSTPTPLSVQNQVLPFHSQCQYPVAAATRQNESFPEDNTSQSLELSSNIGRPGCAPTLISLSSPIVTILS